ncbi:dihydroorotase [Pseudoalteromonas luteoviolacea]|uniref:Dihydroorotase n=1 Tax=Pseudoalteromonas luteoviolacea TaxID=43657 RepID=A0A1C0TTC6_9GAMM|nr:dihydroorotase [Pseudoalteromonas luteoviolacea]OCQ22573.1 dihydroorotase [Pseudoalteromonas luteoviolacea]
MANILIKNAQLVNEGKVEQRDVRIVGKRIDKIAPDIKATGIEQIIDLKGDFLLPGMIDDQVHFREPGLDWKGTIGSESRAAVAGGITSYMEMPNVSPATTDQLAVMNKHQIAARTSAANYSFYLGATPDNLDEIKACDPSLVCGVKVFMGASTGDLLVEHPSALEAIFRECPVLIATHCEKGDVIASNLATLGGKELTIQDHPVIRDANACYQSSSYAVELAKKYGTQLHVLHITTAKEMDLFEPGPIDGKQITAEACVHHLWFNQTDYDRLGNLIKCNPAIKAESDRLALIEALTSGRLDIIATDHAPHTWEEKQQAFAKAPAGLPLVQHALLTLFDQVQQGNMTLPQIVEKTAHNPAKRYKVKERGFVREGFFADLTVVSAKAGEVVRHDNTRYHCQWSPFVGHQFSHQIRYTFVNGECVYRDGEVIDVADNAMPLVFDRS